MTIATTSNRQSYAGNDVSTAFAFLNYFLADADLVVVLRSAAGVETTKVITTDYTVAGAGVPAGGTVTMLVAPATGETLVIYRDPAATQTADYVANDPFPAETHERALDKLTMLIQRVKDLATRTLRFAETSTSVAVTVPDPSEGKFLRWVSGVLSNADISATAVGLPVVIAQGGTGATTQGAAFTAIVGPGGTLTGRIIDKHGADIAAAATLNLTAATGKVVDVTGSTGITAITLADGDEVVVRFTGAPLITDGASLVCLGAKDVQVAAGDYAVFRGYAAGVVRMAQYHRLDGEAVNERQATAIASAGTTDLATVKGRYAHITGTATITALGTVPAGVRKTLVFDGALTFTHNATSLIIPGAANVTTVAGDIVDVVSEGAGNWRVVNYQRASGLAVVAPLPSTFTTPVTSQQDVNASTTLVNATNLSFAVTSGVRYWFRFTVNHASDTITTGFKHSLTTPTFTEFIARSHFTLNGADGVSLDWVGAIDISADAVIPTSQRGGTDVGWVEGFIKPSANGTLQFQFACEVAAGIVSVLPGSFGEMKVVG